MNTLLKITGMKCHELDENLWLITTPQTFADGDYIPVYIEKTGETIRFFDDMEIKNHFEGRGHPVNKLRRIKSLFDALRNDGLTVTNSGIVELVGNLSDAPKLFNQFTSSFVHVIDWEKEREGFTDQVSSLSEEVYNFLSSWKPESTIKQEICVSGISGKKYDFDYTFDGMPVIAISASASAIASAIKKLLDIKANTDNKGQMYAVFDDRKASERMKKDVIILQSVSKSILLSRIERNIKTAGTATVH